MAADAKIFHPDQGRGKAYIAKGFHQIYKYLLDFNNSVGYLVIYNVSNKNLVFALSTLEASPPYFTINHKTVYFITINISPKGVSASKAKRISSIEITDNDLIEIVDEGDGAIDA